MNLRALIASLFRPPVASSIANVWPLPLPAVGDVASMPIGASGLAANINYQLAFGFATIGTTQTLAVLFPTLEPGFVQRTTAPSGNNDTLPTTAAIIAAAPITSPRDGTLQFTSRYINNNTGQTITLVAGDASTTITGTATIATNTWRDYLITIRINAGTVELTNLGGGTL